MAAYERRTGRTPDVIGLEETKLPRDGEAPELDGFYVAARRDRDTGGGGGVLIYVRSSLVASAVEGLADDASEVIAVDLGDGDEPPRFCVVYRPPGTDVGPTLRAIEHYASGARGAFVCGGDRSRSYASPRG